MTLSIGIDYNEKHYQTCLVENGRVLECLIFENVQAIKASIEQTCALYPEPVIAVASGLSTALLPLTALSITTCTPELADFLLTTKQKNLKSYHLPALKFTPGVLPYRRFVHPMGTAHTLCGVATLISRMHQLDASWTDMRFFYLEAGYTSYCITVIIDGLIVDSLANSLEVPSSMTRADDQENVLIEQAFWESLTYSLAGLMAIHQLEDVIVADYDLFHSLHSRKEAVIDHLGDHYQFYHFPPDETEPGGFIVARGAALLAEGLTRPGFSAEIVQRLLMPLS